MKEEEQYLENKWVKGKSTRRELYKEGRRRINRKRGDSFSFLPPPLTTTRGEEGLIENMMIRSERGMEEVEMEQEEG